MEDTIKWLNQNQGVVSAFIFLTSLFIAWFSGIFKFIRNRPIFEIDFIPGPNFCCIVQNDNMFQGHRTKRTAVSIYFSISNTGSSPSSIIDIKIQYKCNVLIWEEFKIWKRFSKFEEKIKNIKFIYKWYPVTNKIISLEEFSIKLNDDKFKYYPFLFQNNTLINHNSILFLETGRNTKGIVYFESEEYWGGYRPKVIDDLVDVKVILHDVYHKSYTKILKIPFSEIEEAKKYNPSFGETYKQCIK